MSDLAYVIVFALGALCGIGVTLLLQLLSHVGCRRKNCEQQEDGYCAKCHADYYG